MIISAKFSTKKFAEIIKKHYFCRRNAKIHPGGEIGRRAWLRAMSTKVGAGSSPVPGTYHHKL